MTRIACCFALGEVSAKQQAVRSSAAVLARAALAALTARVLWLVSGAVIWARATARPAPVPTISTVAAIAAARRAAAPSARRSAVLKPARGATTLEGAGGPAALEAAASWAAIAGRRPIACHLAVAGLAFVLDCFISKDFLNSEETVAIAVHLLEL